MRKIILSTILFLMAFTAQAQISPPGANDIQLNVARGDGTFQSRYVETDKTGAIQFLMFGQDPTPGAPVGQLRVQKRTLDTSITCGPLTSSTCGVNTSGMTIYAAQVLDSSAVGRSVMTASDAAAARLAIGAGTSSFDGTYADLSGVPPTFAPSMHTQPSTTISDSTSAGRAILTAADASTIRGLINVPSVSEVVANYYPLASNPSAYVGTAGARGAISVTGNGSYNSTTGVITINAYTPPARVKTSVTKAVGVCFQLSATRDAWVTYNVEIIASATLIGGQAGALYLETFTDSACTAGTEEVMRNTSGNTNTLIVALGSVLTQTLNVNGYIMAGQYAKLRTVNVTSTPTFTARPGQEVLQ